MKLKDLNRMSSHTTVNWESRLWKLAWLGLFFICTLMTLMFLFMYIFYVYPSHSWALSGAPRCQLVTDDHRKCTRPTSTMCYALCSIQYTVQYALNTKHLNYVQCTMHMNYSLCSMHYALGTLHATHLDHQQPGASPRAAQQHQADPNFGNFLAGVWIAKVLKMTKKTITVLMNLRSGRLFMACFFPHLIWPNDTDQWEALGMFYSNSSRVLPLHKTVSIPSTTIINIISP